MKNMVKFAEFMRRAGACNEAVAWIGDRDMKAAIQECPRWSWMEWALSNLLDKKGFPAAAEYRKVVDPATAEYRKVVDAAHAEYERAIKAWLLAQVEEEAEVLPTVK